MFSDIFRSNIHSYLAQRFLEDVIKQNVNAFLKEANRRHGKEVHVPNEVRIKYAAKVMQKLCSVVGYKRKCL